MRISTRIKTLLESQRHHRQPRVAVGVRRRGTWLVVAALAGIGLAATVDALRGENEAAPPAARQAVTTRPSPPLTPAGVGPTEDPLVARHAVTEEGVTFSFRVPTTEVPRVASHIRGALQPERIRRRFRSGPAPPRWRSHSIDTAICMRTPRTRSRTVWMPFFFASRAANRGPSPPRIVIGGTEPLDLAFYGWPQRDLNPCYRLERAARANSVTCSFLCFRRSHGAIRVDWVGHGWTPFP
jgi:hypothetical protein